MYVVNGSIDDPQPKRKRYHLVLLAKNHTGYRIVKLTTISHLNGMKVVAFFRPCTDAILLNKYRMV